MICKNCGAQNAAGAGECPYCGQPLEAQQPNPPAQEYQSRENASHEEPPVGRRVEQRMIYSEKTVIHQELVCSSKSKTLALILCILVGYFGVHRFYLNKPVSGVVYLFTCGVFGFGWLIDICLILTGKLTDANGNQLR